MMKRLAAVLLALCIAVPAFGQTVAPTTNVPVIIATGNTFQTILTAVTANNQRRSLTIENNNATDSCWIAVGGSLGSAAKGTAILLLPGGSYTRYYPYIPNDAIHATCATSSDTLYVDVQ